MPYVPFHDYFPDIAEKETRSIIAINDKELPRAEYGLVELFCDEPGCDCRRVFFNVISSKTKNTVAVITYGWEGRSFYEKWLGQSDRKLIDELKGPALNLMSMQSSLAPALLKKVKYVLRDSIYVERIKRHYKMFREAIEGQNKQDNIVRNTLKWGRNDPCPCGSGKKYKKCCYGKL